MYKVVFACEAFAEELRKFWPSAKLIFAQVEDRYLYDHCENPELLWHEFKAKANKFNKWLNQWNGKDSLFVMRGVKGFTDPSLYARDGIHLNYDGNVKLAQRLADY